jgi:hypothetical protein
MCPEHIPVLIAFKGLADTFWNNCPKSASSDAADLIARWKAWSSASQATARLGVAATRSVSAATVAIHSVGGGERKEISALAVRAAVFSTGALDKCLRHDVQRCIPDLSGTSEWVTWKCHRTTVEVHYGFHFSRAPCLCGLGLWRRFGCRAGRTGKRSKWSTRGAADEAARAEIGGSQQRFCHSRTSPRKRSAAIQGLVGRVERRGGRCDASPRW